MSEDLKSMDFEQYAEDTPHPPETYLFEIPQKERVQKMAARCVGTVLDVGSADGFTSHIFEMFGHAVVACDVSETRCRRVTETYGIEAILCYEDRPLPFEDASFDTVVLGEVLEHTPNPGLLLAEACRVAKERVVISVPLNGWADPTHQWRISIDTCGQINPLEPTKGVQAVMTWQRGACWPRDYFLTDPKWKAQFWDEPTSDLHIGVQSDSDE